MVTQESKTVETVNQVEKPVVKKKKTGWGMFLTFLMYGGWLLILVIGLGIAIAVSVLTASPK